MKKRKKRLKICKKRNQNIKKTYKRTPKCNGVLSSHMESTEKETNSSQYPILVGSKRQVPQEMRQFPFSITDKDKWRFT